MASTPEPNPDARCGVRDTRRSGKIVFTMKVEEEYFDVLQNLEWAIVNEFRQDRSILDMDAREAVAALARIYEAEAESRGASRSRLTSRAERIFQAVKTICEWRLGRGEDVPMPEPIGTPLKPAELVLCLKKIRSSVELWNKRNGRQGYPEFVSGHVR